ncbi:MAG: D-alanyl-D-alanine carboxypeptidase family protein [Ruminococcaceae bacterium]|nr:D-alanyl-D-alanine carboxypeptidase family protein [Oscillospiraceae bacterium]
MNRNSMHNQPIRRYRRQKGYDSARRITVLMMAGIILLGVVVFVMSLTGTGLFADRDPSDGNELPVGTEGSDDLSGEESSSEPDESTPDLIIPDEDVEYEYLNLTPEDIKKGDLLLIDATHPYTFPSVQMAYIAEYKSSSYKIGGTRISLQLKVIHEMNKMMDAFEAATGMKDAIIQPGNAYRSFDDQKKLYDKNPTSAAVPGSSDYHTGASFLFQIYNEVGISPMSSRSESIWLKENAHDYGFTFRFPADKKHITGYSVPWQMRYVGISHATYMYDKFLCLEEYLAFLSEKHKYAGEHLFVECGDGYIYEVFYVEGATEGVIQVPVPKNREYTVSGDNQKGFVVSFKLCASTKTAE